MTVAMPIWQERISPVFDTASRLLVVRHGRAREQDRRELALGALEPEALARSVVDLGVDVLLCGGISEPLRRALERGGVRVEGDLCGPAEALLRAFRAGRWRHPEFQMPGCRGRKERRVSRRPGTGARAASPHRPGRVPS